jgi:hypothetical protein
MSETLLLAMRKTSKNARYARYSHRVFCEMDQNASSLKTSSQFPTTTKNYVNG